MDTHSIPYRHQENEEYYCGPAVVQMIFAAAGHERSQAELATILGTDASGTSAEAIEYVLMSTGFTVERLNGAQFSDIQAAVAAGATVIVGYIETTDHKFAHYGIVGGITDIDITIIDPLLEHLTLARADFESRWRDDEDHKYGERMMMAVRFPAEEHVG